MSKYVFLKILPRATCLLQNSVTCVLVYLVATMSASREDVAQDFIEHVLRIPNPDKILNSVLSRLQSNRQGVRSRPRYDDADCDPAFALPEYTESLEESRERGLRKIGSQKHYPICNLERIIIRLNTNEYEYRPAYYEEVRCNTSSRDNSGTNYDEICSSLGFSCVQWNKTIHLTRRRYSSDCWETKTMVIPAGCECMWPINKLGDIAAHV